MQSLTFTLIFLSILSTTFAQINISCDIIIAGGSTAALAASLHAAQFDIKRDVCLLEPTNWPGGQLTSSAVSAVDYGPQDRKEANQAKDFYDMLNIFKGNPGQCWVSIKCFQPLDLLNGWIFPKISNLTNLHIYYNTVVKDVIVSNDGLTITGIKAIQRTPVNGTTGWEKTFSNQVEDWYTYSNSSSFTKQNLTFTGKPNSLVIIIDATELGDVLILSRAPWAQGVESPNENSTTYDSGCGQTTTNPFYLKYNSEKVSPPNVPDGPSYVNYGLNNYSWGQIWSYRRSLGYTNQNYATVNEISNQNWGTPPGNDYPYGYIFLNQSEIPNQLNDWKGGLNITALNQAELTAFGWIKWYINHSDPANISDYLSLNYTIPGTGHGLSKMPYLRDTRRSIGLDGFRLFYNNLTGSGSTGVEFPDKIAIGDYFYADFHRLYVCNYPSYLSTTPVLPFYLPFRSLTNQKYGNLLVAGKTMAQTFHANAATRLHPIEWATGLAAGIASTMLSQMQTTTGKFYADSNSIINLQSAILAAGSPLNWTLS